MLFGFCALIGTAASAESLPSFPTHCFPGEFSVVNATMGRIDHTQNELVIAKNGKVLSLCADSPREPFGRLVYRYGPIGKVEFEKSASSARTFGVYSRATGDNMREDLVYFSVGKFTYYVAIGQGMGRGVSLLVFDGDKEIVNLFSGINDGTDFALGPAEISFEQATSPVFKVLKPAHDF
jgi:hypothetical protein